MPVGIERENSKAVAMPTGSLKLLSLHTHIPPPSLAILLPAFQL